METVSVRGVPIGDGLPRIIVPLTADTQSAIFSEAEDAAACSADIIEWRADLFCDEQDTLRVGKVLTALREILKEKPLLFTYRRREEGGEGTRDLAAYEELLSFAADHRAPDLIDVELMAGAALVGRVIKEAHDKEKRVIISSHDFEKTPPKEALLKQFQKMDQTGADILKIAVMPHEKQEVLRLLSAAVETKELLTERPIIAISMGELGLISRISAEVFGSACTFAALHEASAPGQIPVEGMRQILLQMHDQLGGIKE